MIPTATLRRLCLACLSWAISVPVCADGNGPDFDFSGHIKYFYVLTAYPEDSVFRDISGRKEIERQREAAYTEILQLKEQLENERDYLRDEININSNFGEIIGDSQALQLTLAQIEAVAITSASVLIQSSQSGGFHHQI